jgi:hypothetical protein
VPRCRDHHPGELSGDIAGGLSRFLRRALAAAFGDKGVVPHLLRDVKQLVGTSVPTLEEE